MTVCPASFHHDGSATTVGPRGQLAHALQFEQAERVSKRWWTVRPGVWCYVGNGLSNQTFVEGPEGIIAIDSGESVEEMAAALAMLRQCTDRPIAAVIYTHFHYVSGTAAIDDDLFVQGYPIWGHEGIVGNRSRMATETSAVLRRGLTYQFGLALPADGDDGVVSMGLGTWFRNPEHAPFTPGFKPPTHTITEPTTTRIAGLTVEMTPAPSDADDSITIWFPELSVAVDNIVWPVLFNVFAIRGEEYRDPRRLISGLEHVAGLGAQHLIGAHGPPISGVDAVSDAIIRSRDAMQFLWDQTVRGINRDLSAGELIEFVQLPASYDESYVTQQLYGLVEHHVRQIHTGVRGWFDGLESELFPLPTAERARRLIAGFGGRDEVHRQAAAALESDDLRWALELATWLVRSEASDPGGSGAPHDDRNLLARVLRTIAQRTTSANLRNWGLTRARELEGALDLSRLRRSRFSAAEVLAGDPAASVRVLRVLLVPQRCEGVDVSLAWVFEGGATTGLHVRNGVAVPTDGEGAQHIMRLSFATWAGIVGGKSTFGDALSAGRVVIDGDVSIVRSVLACFEHPSLEQ